MVHPASTSRVVVVGAGVGGLVTSIELASRGVEVVVLERASCVGGKMREVTVGGRAIDAGPTVLTMRHVFEAVFASAGERLEDHLTLRPADVLARHAWPDGATLDLFADEARSADAIGRMAGSAEAKGYRAFCAYARRIYDTVEGPFLRSARPTLGSVLKSQGLLGMASLARIDAMRTVWRSLEEFFRDARLRQLFGRYATYCGSSPYLAPATLNVIAHVEREGVYLVEGGMYRVAEALAKLARRKGVTIRCDAPVAEVIVKGGRATGVRLSHGERLDADAVVMNADVAALARGLFGEAPRKAWPVDEDGGRSLSAVTFSLAVKTSGFPLVRHNVFFSSDYAREFKDIFERERLPDDPTVYVCAQDRDDSARAPGDGIDRMLWIVNAPARGGRAPFTPSEIERCEQQTRTQLSRMGLTVERDTSRCVITTPDEFEKMFPATGGALYGPPSHGWTSPLRRAPSSSNLPGLFLAGGSAHPGAGVPMVAQSGRLAAASVLESLASTARSPRAATRGGTSTL